MSFTGYFGLLLLFLCQSIVISRADWKEPRLLEPVPKEDVIRTWDYIKPTARANILLEEEVDHEVCIAILNFEGSEEPYVGPMEDAKSNFVLGAEIRKDSSTGEWSLWITKKQDYETPIMQKYRFPIIAGSSTYPTIVLNIANIDDNPPIIRPQPIERHCAIEENYVGPSNCTYIVSDADGWIDQVSFALSASPDDGKKHFNFITSRVSGARENYDLNAYLNVTESLDFESITMHMLQINATDGGDNKSNITTVIEVIDMPDMPPAWTKLTAAEYILEKTTKNFSVSAMDGDIQINAVINYRIEPVGNERDEEYFVVDQSTGVITIKPIDRDALQKEVFRFKIIAYEVPEPESKINATIIVVVEDVNDNIPKITPEVLKFQIEEEKFTTLDQPITVRDPDLAENGQFSVSLIDESPHGWSSAFLVVPNSGYQEGVFTISVVNASLLDYEDPNWRNIDIKLQAVEKADPSHVDTRDIRIELINWNDELPIFDSDAELEVSLPEDVLAQYKIATVHATDRDVGDKVTHSLIGAQRNMLIDEESGVIVTTQNDTFDYESMRVVVVQVVATDLPDLWLKPGRRQLRSDGMSSHHTYATLTINVTDVNDVPPQLYLPKQIPTLVEEKNDIDVEALITAEDVDTEAELFFSIDWDNTKAQKRSVPVDESLYREHLGIRTEYPEKGHKRKATGTLFVSGRIDYEAFDVIFLTISVTDNTTVHNANTTSASLTLDIVDINDNWPVFELPDPMNVDENQVTDALIGTITATDADGPNYNNVTYSIKPVNGTADDLVFINPLTGVIRVMLDKGIDAEKYTYIYYEVIASDGENNTPLHIEIFVIDQNDEVPYLLNEKFDKTIHVREKSPNGTEIVAVWAKDDDRTCPFNEVSYLINDDYAMQYFSMGRSDGRIEVNTIGNHILDRDYGTATFTVNLMLRDNYIHDSTVWNTNAFPYAITIILDDINDQKPLLPDQTEPFSVSETMNKNELIATVEARDDDDPETNNTKVNYKILSIEPIDGIYDGVDNKCKDMFRVETRDESKAEIFANCNLKGYFGRWTVELYAQDRGTDPGPLNHTNKYVIQINDFNYNDPVIEFPTKKKILLRVEQTTDAQLRTYDGQLLNDFTATDKDHGNSGTVTFSLADNDYFTVVPTGKKNVGQLQLVKKPDIEKENTYKLSLTATDGGSQPRSVTQDLTVVFITNLGPKFEDNEWTVWFTENKTGLSESFTLPQATDMVSDAGENAVDLYYFFTNEEGDAKFFNLDKLTRNLSLSEELDREKQEIMTLVVVVTTDRTGPPGNPPKDSILTITVVVVDVNDNPPIFEIKPYRGGVAIGDPLDKVILTVKATDADINETLTYSVVEGSMSTSDSSISGVDKPFSIDEGSGELLLKFTPTSDMKGNFDFRIVVYDAVEHNDTKAVQIYMISPKNRVIFTFKNVASYVKQEQNFVIQCFDNSFKYLSNIDDIKSAVGSDDQVLDNVTSLTTHFISPVNKLPVKSDEIIVAASDLQTINDLKENLLTRSLRLVDVPTGTAAAADNTQETIHWILVTLTIFFCLSCVVLAVIFVVRTRRLKKRLDNLAITKYGSQESGLDKAGVVPTTNQFALAGSNPMWRTSETNVDDNVSQGSGDSDLIGVEDNPDFGYANEAFRNDNVWENARRGSVNPVLANHEATSRNRYDRNLDTLESSPEEDTKSIHSDAAGWKMQ